MVSAFTFSHLQKRWKAWRQLYADPFARRLVRSFSSLPAPRPGREDVQTIDRLHLELVPVDDDEQNTKVELQAFDGGKALLGRIIAPEQDRYRLLPLAPLTEADCESIELVVLPAAQNSLTRGSIIVP